MVFTRVMREVGKEYLWGEQTNISTSHSLTNAKISILKLIAEQKIALYSMQLDNG